MADLLPPRPRAGYYFGYMEVPQRKEAQTEVVDRLLVRFDTVMQATYDAAGLETAKPRDRLAFYQRKPPEVWAEQQAKYPRDYEEDMADFGKLVERERNGDFDESEA